MNTIASLAPIPVPIADHTAAAVGIWSFVEDPLIVITGVSHTGPLAPPDFNNWPNIPAEVGA